MKHRQSVGMRTRAFKRARHYSDREFERTVLQHQRRMAATAAQTPEMCPQCWGPKELDAALCGYCATEQKQVQEV